MDSLEKKLRGIKDSTSNSLKQRKSTKYSIDPELVLTLLEEGSRMSEIAQLYGCCDQTIKYQMRLIDPNFDGRQYNKWRKREITVEGVVKLYEELKSSTKIAKLLGVNTHAITDRLKAAGIKLRSLHRGDVTVEKVSELYREYGTTQEVADILNTNPATVRRRLDTAGIKYKKRNK